jgi:hypothetical protein
MPILFLFIQRRTGSQEVKEYWHYWYKYLFMTQRVAEVLDLRRANQDLIREVKTIAEPGSSAIE